MNDGLKKESIKEQDIEAVVQLHNTFINDDRTSQQWKHQYLEFIPDKSVFTILKDNEKVIGSQGMLPFFLMIDKKILSGKSENSLLDPQYRGGSLFQELYDFAMSLCEEKKMELIWGFTPLVYVWRNKLQFNVFEGVMYQAMKIINLKSAIKSLTTRIDKSNRNRLIKSSRKIITLILLFLLKTKASFQQRIYLKNIHKDTSIVLKNRLESDNDIKQLFQRFNKKHPGLIYIDQDSDFIKWRLYSNPNLNYQTYFGYQNGNLKGYCYCTVNKQLGRGYMTDFAFEDPQVGKVLLNKALSYFNSEKVSFAIFYGNFENSIIRKTWSVLKKSGFSKKKNPSAVVIKNISFKEPERLMDIKNWHMTGLWTEGYTM